MADRGIDVDRLFTDRYKLEQAEAAYKLFDTQTTGKGVFLFQQLRPVLFPWLRRRRVVLGYG